MYTLLLTYEERMAIDWVGNRYDNGNNLYKILWGYCETIPENADWNSREDITFQISESSAWAINDNGDRENYLWPCFSSAFAQKMQSFCDNIV